jgi:hypothetical protein
MARLGGNDGTTNFTPPIEEVKGNVKSVSSYSDRVRRAQAKTASLKGKGKPLGGAPPIPPGRMEALTKPKPDFGEPEPEEAPPLVVGTPPPIRGVGSSYRVNQDLATGKIGGPVSVAEAKKKAKAQLSATTQEALKHMDRNVKTSAPTEEKAPQPVLESPERAKETEKELDRTDKELERPLPEFDFEGLIRARNALLSEERRKKIESRLETLDIADLVTKREVTQKVPVVPGRLDFTFRTMTQYENLFCLQYVYEFPGSDTYLREVLNTSKLVCSLVAINDAVLHNHLSEDGKHVDRDEFEKKWDQVIGFPVQLVGDMSVQLIWFSNRVQDLFDIGHLKNG